MSYHLPTHLLPQPQRFVPPPGVQLLPLQSAEIQPVAAPNIRGLLIAVAVVIVILALLWWFDQQEQPRRVQPNRRRATKPDTAALARKLYERLEAEGR